MEALATIVIMDVKDIAAARNFARSFAKEFGFSTVDQTRIITVVSELARNLYLYANQGQIILYKHQNCTRTGIRIYAADSGPGIIDIQKVMEIGYSTSGGLGAGLPGVRRIMDEFTISSSSEEGTKIDTVKWLR
ncbi:anti-sigma regulatory factor [Rossellomorea vietnamensis]|uniref:Anti-sigma regulatory factor n=1 Tax=Rossellomorea vietnamensis TaxID=218284 RepID=A0A5D4ME61_9BACI|nr:MULTISPECIES: anti-sigma regulatory factor [Bacillaceae]TYR99758.1 anti-sigma regulatory factor [Rossellomorea vietnamensis]